MEIKRFFKKLLRYGFQFFVAIEILSRVFVESAYTRFTNNYIVPYSQVETSHVDNLFIGSSRVPATIDVKVWNKLEPEKVNVVAGRGFSTPGTHIQALESRIELYPDFILGSDVFLEFTGVSIYASSYSEDRFRIMESHRDGAYESNVHVLIPYLRLKDLPAVLKHPSNRWAIKLEICMKFFFSSYRTIDLINEHFHRKSYMRTAGTEDHDMVSEGGIRADKIDETRALAIRQAKNMINYTVGKKLVDRGSLDKSSLAFLDNLIRSNGGRLILYEIPLHSIQAEVVQQEEAQVVRKVFLDWCDDRSIPIIYHTGFKFKDADIPDMKHLGRARRPEFTHTLYQNRKTLSD